MKPILTSMAVAGATLAFAACGSDSDEQSETAGHGSDATALTELGETRAGLAVALNAYKAGDKEAAEEAVSEAYLEHFEHVEGPLEAKDEELSQRLEDGIREGLRDEVKSDKPGAEVEKAFGAVYADMDKAEALLR